MTSVFGDYGITRAQAAALVHPGFVPGQSFYALTDVSTVAVTPAAADTLYLHFFPLPLSRVFAGLFARVAGTPGTGSSMKQAVWRSVNGRPAGVPLLGNNTGVATTSLGIASQAIANVNAPAGGYWYGSVHTGSVLPGMIGIAVNRSGSALVGAASAAAAMPGSSAAQLVGLSAPMTFANDIMATDLTSATFTGVASAILPLGCAEYA